MTLDSSNSLTDLVKQAQTGERHAVELFVRAIQPNVYKLAQRFLFIPADADDATQEILLKIITKLAQFDFRSHVNTWVYRVASNHLLDIKKTTPIHAFSFEEFAQDLNDGLDLQAQSQPEDEKLYGEIRIGCTLALLHCLNPETRISYILGEILELDHQQAADVLQISTPTYRKRLSRARNQLIEFMQTQCGLVNQHNTCRCNKRVDKAKQLGRIDPNRLIFITSDHAVKQFPEVLSQIRELEETQRVAALYRAQVEPECSNEFTTWLRGVISQQEAQRSQWLN